MRALLQGLIMAILLLQEPAAAQNREQSGLRQWLASLFGVSKEETAPTQIHPQPGPISAQDRAREERLEQSRIQKQFTETKERLRADLRAENNRRVIGAIAKAVPTPPFRPEGPQLTPRVREGSKPYTLWPAEVEGRKIADDFPATLGPPPKLPGLRSLPQQAAETVDEVVQKVGENVFGKEAATQTPRGLFVLALIGMFLIPSAGAALVLIGLQHLRGHSFFSGTVIVLIGGAMLWGAIVLASDLNPNQLSRPKTDAPEPAEAKSQAASQQALRSELLWPNN